MENKKARNVRSGSYPLKNLKFLYDFAAEMNLTVGDLAARMGLSRQSVYYWFKKDDVKISNIYRLFDVLGYEIRFSLTDMKEEANPNVKVTSKLYSPETPKNLDFLTIALNQYRINKTDLCRDLNLGATTIYSWQVHDDCFMSYIFRIAEMRGLRLNIDINPYNDCINKLVY